MLKLAPVGGLGGAGGFGSVSVADGTGDRSKEHTNFNGKEGAAGSATAGMNLATKILCICPQDNRIFFLFLSKLRLQELGLRLDTQRKQL